MDQYQCHDSQDEQARITSLLAILPHGVSSVLEIGTGEGHITGRLASMVPRVATLDIVRPRVDVNRVPAVQADIADLCFKDRSFDVVVCAEVLEHIRPDMLEQACRECARVARRAVVIGVPYRQDLRIGRTTCRSCGRPNPPWGHVNTFDDIRLAALFHTMTAATRAFVGEERRRSNPMSAFLLDRAGNPGGTYEQQEPCVYCERRLAPPPPMTWGRKACSKLAVVMIKFQSVWVKPAPAWVHMVFQKPA